jgi:hypothetical protein
MAIDDEFPTITELQLNIFFLIKNDFSLFGKGKANFPIQVQLDPIFVPHA